MVKLERKDIHKEEYYSASQIACSGLLPWKTVMTFTAKLRDPDWQKVFNPLIEKKEFSIRYRIRGSSLLQALEAIEQTEHGQTQ